MTYSDVNMTYEEYATAAQGFTPENAPVILQNLLESIKTDLEERDAFKAALDERDSKIRDLQDTNQKLFLSQLSPNTNGVKEEEPLTGEEYINKMLSDVGAI